MNALGCAVARTQLQAYHDGELPVSGQIEVSVHLDYCAACSAELRELRGLGSALRAAGPGRTGLHDEEWTGLHASVVSRVDAENTLALAARVREMFEDMHFVYAGMGAAGATVACLTIMLSMMNFAAVTSPGFNQNPVVVDARMLMPHAVDQRFYPLPDPAADAHNGDETFTVSGVVTREGRLMNLELHPEDGQSLPAAGTRAARAVETMLDVMAQQRFEPARVGGLPIAVNMVWLVAHTTVRGEKVPMDVPAVRAAKKRPVNTRVLPPLRKLTVA